VEHKPLKALRLFFQACKIFPGPKSSRKHDIVSAMLAIACGQGLNPVTGQITDGPLHDS
jgi:hypothetical protein